MARPAWLDTIGRAYAGVGGAPVQTAPAPRPYGFRMPGTAETMTLPPAESMSAAPVSWRDRMSDVVRERLGKAYVKPLMTLADASPLGVAFAGNEARLAANRGGYGEAAGGLALAALPLPGAAKTEGRALAREAERGIIAYHGSPHSFDRFDMSKIGTGEGAQAYGHGLYFAENEDVARGYRDGLAGATPVYKGKRFDGTGSPSEPGMSAAYRVHKAMQNGASFEEARQKALEGADWSKRLFERRLIEMPDDDGSRLAIEQAVKEAEELKALTRQDISSESPGSMYQVRIDADPADFLDWDAPVGQQSEKVRNALHEAGIGDVGPVFRIQDGLGNELPMTFGSREEAARRIAGKPDWTVTESPSLMRGDAAYRRMIEQLPRERSKWEPVVGGVAWDRTDKLASEVLSRGGIKGIRYKDQGSRMISQPGTGTSNYVVFDDKLVTILKKYGWVPGMAIPAAAMAEYQAQYSGQTPDGGI